MTLVVTYFGQELLAALCEPIYRTCGFIFFDDNVSVNIPYQKPEFKVKGAKIVLFHYTLVWIFLKITLLTSMDKLGKYT